MIGGTDDGAILASLQPRIIRTEREAQMATRIIDQLVDGPAQLRQEERDLIARLADLL